MGWVFFVGGRGPGLAWACSGAAGPTELGDFISQLAKPRAVWLMVPAASVDAVVQAQISAQPEDVATVGADHVDRPH